MRKQMHLDFSSLALILCVPWYAFVSFREARQASRRNQPLKWLDVSSNLVGWMLFLVGMGVFGSKGNDQIMVVGLLFMAISALASIELRRRGKPEPPEIINQ